MGRQAASPTNVNSLEDTGVEQSFTDPVKCGSTSSASRVLRPTSIYDRFILKSTRPALRSAVDLAQGAFHRCRRHAVARRIVPSETGARRHSGSRAPACLRFCFCFTKWAARLGLHFALDAWQTAGQEGGEACPPRIILRLRAARRSGTLRGRGVIARHSLPNADARAIMVMVTKRRFAVDARSPVCDALRVPR